MSTVDKGEQYRRGGFSPNSFPKTIARIHDHAMLNMVAGILLICRSTYDTYSVDVNMKRRSIALTFQWDLTRLHFQAGLSLKQRASTAYRTIASHRSKHNSSVCSDDNVLNNILPDHYCPSKRKMPLVLVVLYWTSFQITPLRENTVRFSSVAMNIISGLSSPSRDNPIFSFG